ncbi:MAG: cyclic nucleotide-binding domain-containing protein [Xanthomonadales bacterium]|nr:cyclic nucleotide-binding domain-containing protein [Xanthomonadales bacterium]
MSATFASPVADAPAQRRSAPLELDQKALERLLAHCRLKRYAKRALLMRPGDPADVLAYLIRGSLEVCAADDEGREIILARVNPGEFVGELGLFLNTGRRSVAVRARASSQVAEISYARLFELFERDLAADCPRILFAIGRQISQRLLQSRRKVSRLASLDVISRIWQTVLDLCAEPDALSHPRGTQIKVSRIELSRMVGCSREVAGRALKRLQEQGLLVAAGKTVIVFGVKAGVPAPAQLATRPRAGG